MLCSSGGNLLTRVQRAFYFSPQHTALPPSMNMKCSILHASVAISGNLFSAAHLLFLGPINRSPYPHSAKLLISVIFHPIMMILSSAVARRSAPLSSSMAPATATAVRLRPRAHGLRDASVRPRRFAGVLFFLALSCAACAVA